ncbi:hypothetical protein [Haloarcula sp. Atlit-7R]|uniref:hypothetical protein n=1 Tax=Haloarcula sp. Atlit-7R TaxID=2282125 RepID=UPI0011C47FDD|nr:hypothetical protein [Haloarcula sp. Atlit-7R]
MEAVYNQLDPSLVLEKEGFPRWDIFVEAVAGQLQLTPAMIERCDQSLEYGNLHVHLLSLTDIFVFKSITEREGDLEDAALIARQTDPDWESIFQEIKTQEDRTGQFFSFAVLDTLDVLNERHNIVAPSLTGSSRTALRTRCSSRWRPRKQPKISEKSWSSPITRSTTNSGRSKRRDRSPSTVAVGSIRASELNQLTGNFAPRLYSTGY